MVYPLTSINYYYYLLFIKFVIIKLLLLLFYIIIIIKLNYLLSSNNVTVPPAWLRVLGEGHTTDPPSLHLIEGVVLTPPRDMPTSPGPQQPLPITKVVQVFNTPASPTQVVAVLQSPHGQCPRPRLPPTPQSWGPPPCERTCRCINRSCVCVHYGYQPV